MDKILVHGGRRLSGSIKVSGSKNSSLPILAATLLTREPCVVHGVPDLSDTNYMLQILAHLGAQVERASGTVTVTAEKIHCVAPYDVVRKMRASVCVLGPLLGRCKEASVAHFFKQAYIDECGNPCEEPLLDGKVVQEFPKPRKLQELA